MEVSTYKSSFLCHGICGEVVDHIHNIFPFVVVDVEIGLKYLGYRLKTNNYTATEWTWLIKKVDFRINVWCYKWLSLGGRLTLINYIVNSIHVYWFSLVVVSTSTLKVIRGKIFNFLWSGTVNYRCKIHLTSWESISKPKALGGWGIEHLSCFYIALILKTIWKGLSGCGLWGDILKKKYLNRRSLVDWIRNTSQRKAMGSII